MAPTFRFPTTQVPLIPITMRFLGCIRVALAQTAAPWSTAPYLGGN
jgi:hypothetical protein